MEKFQSFSLCGSKTINQDGRNTFHDWNGGVKFLLLGRFIWGKPMNIKNYWSVMCQVWSYLDLNIVQFQDRIYQLFFLEEDSRKKPLERCPWCFDNYLLIIKPWDPAIEALGFDFEPLLTACPFTFHISHLPLGYHTIEVGFMIASFLSHCSEFQSNIKRQQILSVQG